ncbi:MAG: hypothetical protein M1833_006721 [Piccolia ochrophora]|nr:MAG: hypothetical protein M1833_006721 [Piccolia ochrophora]
MAPPPPAPPNPPRVAAVFTSPTSATTSFTHPLGAASTSSDPSAGEKAAYLAELRAHVTKLQQELNVFLTEKMEEDKAAAAKLGSVARFDEGKEEEGYGEEEEEEG